MHHQSVRSPHNTLNRLHSTKSSVKHSYHVLMFMLILSIVMSWLFFGVSHAAGKGSEIKSGWSGYCLDNHKSNNANGNPVDLWRCNNTVAQKWQVTLTKITNSNNLCLTADSNTKITLDICSQSPNQVWLRDNDGFLNSKYQRCLTAPSENSSNLILSSCNFLTSSSQKWLDNIDYATYSCSGTEGQIVACNAIKEWVKWTSEPNNHIALLNKYTDGASYEDWCADFVSYVYKESGHPFSNGNYQGWDENIANDIVNQGFSVRSANNYQPSPGDVAFFNYPGGHVEIVVAGGKNPTFIYGDSATIDPTTGNGNMEANTILRDASLGQIQYYMLPNSST